MKRVFRWPSPAMVVAIAALIVALGGTAVAGGLLTKKKVNKIITQRAPGLSVAHAKSADNVGGRTAASLQVQCPADTAAAGGVCIELTQRPATDWLTASINCGARGLPNLSQLLSFVVSHPGLSGTEWSSDVWDSSTIGVIDMSSGYISGSNTPHPYRCMTTPAN